MKKLVKSLSYLLAVSLMVVLLPNDAQAANYIYEWVGQNGTISADGLAHEFTNLQAGQTIQLSLVLRNESDYAVRARHLLGNPDFGRQVPNGSYGIGSQTPYQDGTPSFLDPSSFTLNNNRFVYYEGEDVSHGRDVHISWTIKLKDNLTNGVYNLYVRPVFEYVAWTKQIKNGQLLPSTNSDIFWKLVVGNATPTSEYVTYTDSEYGFTFEYEKPTPPGQLIESSQPSTHPDYYKSLSLAVPETGTKWGGLSVYKESNFQTVINKRTSELNSIEGESKNTLVISTIVRNNLNFTVFKYHQEYADANVEERFTQLPNGYVISITSWGWFKANTDSRMLDSLRYYNSPDSWEIFVNSGQSMEPTILDNAEVTIAKGSSVINGLARGDIVLFKYPLNPTFKFLKRLIGMPGETVMIKDGYVYINNILLSEPYLPAGTYTASTLTTTLVANEFFVLGDNRPNSSDSRQWGKLPKSNIVGKVVNQLSY
ncbi:MAG: signal peptidase I [Patescibacteria group bacterium]